MFFKKKDKKLLSDIGKELEYDERRWELEKPLLDRRLKLEEEQKAYRKQHSPIKISTSKLLIAFLFINCTLIELFTGWTMIKMLSLALIAGTMIDFTPLVALIGAVVGEVFGYAIYSLKSAKENTVGGIVYDTVMRDNPPSPPNDNAVG